MENWETELKILKEEYVRASNQRLERMSHLLERLSSLPDDWDSLEELHLEFHSFSGSGSTYGLPRVSAIGMRGEQDCSTHLLEKQPTSQKALNQWKMLLDELYEAFQEDSSPVALTDQFTPAESHRNLDILIIDDEIGTCEMLKRSLMKEGFAVRIAMTKERAIRAIQENVPAGMIVDVRLPDGTGYEIVKLLRHQPGGENSTILMISGVSGFLDKVEAIHCGADGYFDKPVDWEAMLRRLNDLIQTPEETPTRILYVEDDASQAGFYRMVLESAGYQVRICEDPKYLEADLSSYNPHLLLMDILLPSVSGVELVRFIRKQERFAALPIIFLTTQAQTETRMNAVKAGGDDYLHKPAPPGLLLSTVAAKLERARVLKSLIQRDGLTGLLTHSAFHERARLLVSRASREPPSSMILAMIDLDHFKNVNDLFGHLIGDRVLTSLASFFRKRLRQSDVVGRYGGEEFAAIVDSLSEKDAIRLFTRLVKEFSEIQHQSSSGETFVVTFSIGIASLDSNKMDLQRWIKAADQALYAAKCAGRNCVVAFSDIPS